MSKNYEIYEIPLMRAPDRGRFRNPRAMASMSGFTTTAQYCAVNHAVIPDANIAVFVNKTPKLFTLYIPNDMLDIEEIITKIDGKFIDVIEVKEGLTRLAKRDDREKIYFSLTRTQSTPVTCQVWETSTIPDTERVGVIINSSGLAVVVVDRIDDPRNYEIV